MAIMSRWESGGCNMVVDNGLSVNGILKLVSNDRNYCHDASYRNKIVNI